MSNNRFSDEVLFSVEGVLTELHISATTVNLLKEIETKLAGKNLAGGLAAAANGMYGALANSAMLSLYDGEDMFNFAALVNGKVVCGVFDKANKLKNGDVVKLVVSERGEVLHVHSLLRIEDSLLLMPLNVYCGERAFFKGCMRVAWRFTLFAWLVMFAGFFYSVDISMDDLVKPLIASSIMLLLPVLILFPFEYWTYKSMRYYSLYASAIFTAYGFPLPDDLDIRSGMILYKDAAYGFGAINCEIALQKHRDKYKLNHA
ncbi:MULTISPECIES: hypothetical protein [Janthinobacterium]|uniref:Uncharacterized protein n=1 Tax=Janthinobacterium lividum TaxID=29581 RepID=A0AB38C7D8_9BURK|nr:MULTISPECIES: hypothetical protein [Janthinobacterium]MBW3499321.1 hypothetical protein [Janthinobacterium sp. NKUCC08_JDC]SFX45916.1 hypothetical protein SAMN03097694_2285 [Janthinobacterium lividum]